MKCGVKVVCPVVTTLLAALVTVALAAWQENVRPKMYVQLGAEDDVHHFTGNESHTDYFRLMLLDGHSLLLGGRNLIYNLSLADMGEQHRLVWYSNEQDLKMCFLKGKDNDDCQNYIRVLTKITDNRLLVCGTNAFKPICREYSFNRGNYSVEKETSGQAMCPYSPRHNSTAIYADGFLYTGSVADFSGRDALIYRDPLQTEQFDSLNLNGPNFVGSTTSNDFVYFFFRETAVEYINCGKAIYSRVARVCKNDRGGPHRFRNRWTSFLKSRLNCSVTGDFPFYFNEIQSTTELISGRYGNTKADLIYGTFTTPTNSISGSAVCAFSLQDIMDTFEGKFKEQSDINSNWLPVDSSRVPDPRPGQCHNDSRTLPDLTLNFIRTHSLMDESVPSFFGQPILIRTVFHYRFTHIAVDAQVRTLSGKTYDVLFIGTDNGKIIKAINGQSADTRHGVRPIVIEEIQVFPTHVPVRSIKVVRNGQQPDGRLIVIADGEVQSLRLHRCDSNKISSCSECVALQDPYCAWDKNEGKCRSNSSKAWTDKSQFYQSVATGQHEACPQSNFATKGTSSLGGLSSSQPKFSMDHQPSKDQPDGQIVNIVPDKTFNGGDAPSVSAADSASAPISMETLIMAVVAAIVSASAVGFLVGYLCGRKCRKDEDDNLAYPDNDYEYFGQRQNMNRIQAEPKLLPQEEVTYAEPVLAPQPPPTKLMGHHHHHHHPHSPKNTLRKGCNENGPPPPPPASHPTLNNHNHVPGNGGDGLFPFQNDYNNRENNFRSMMSGGGGPGNGGGPGGIGGRDNFGTLRSQQGDNYRRGDGFATTRSVKKVYL